MFAHARAITFADFSHAIAILIFVGDVKDQPRDKSGLPSRFCDDSDHIGKCAIKNEVLLKPGALTDEEREHMCIHPEVGSSMLASFSLFSECARYVRGHHERWDGAGYPDKLVGENIPLGARIIAVADTYDAMTTTRPYRKALPLVEARRRLAEGAGTQWDPRCISAFLKLLETTPLGQPQPAQLHAPAAPANIIKAA